jgi:8-oxo-dGTP diphosphatase
VIPRTLCFIRHGDDVLLMKRGLHNKAFPGRYNGIGGHIERDEDPFTSAHREIAEETGLRVVDLQLRGTMHIDAGGAVGILLFVFTATATTRDVRDSDEGTLQWVLLSQAEALPLVDDLPPLLARLYGPAPRPEPFSAHVRYDDADQRVITFAER